MSARNCSCQENTRRGCFHTCSLPCPPGLSLLISGTRITLAFRLPTGGLGPCLLIYFVRPHVGVWGPGEEPRAASVFQEFMIESVSLDV